MKTKIISSLMTLALLLTIGIANAQWSLTGNANTTPPSNFIGTTTGQALIFKTNGAEWMQITTSGNVGIGTTSPIAKLQVAGGAITIDNNWSYTSLLSNGSSKAILRISTGDYTELHSAANGIVFKNNGNSEKMRMDNNGNLGIGTTLVSNPNNYRLAVNGTIGAKEIKVEMSSTTWPDYVFETKYKLKSIKDLETFIKVNKHLPNVPSAEETEKDGINLVKMDATLLEKIEELSLYIIELNKKIEAQNARIELLIKQ